MMRNALFLTSAALAFALLPAIGNAQPVYRRANPISAADPSQGRCTVSVVVNGTTDVEIRGDNATLRDISGYPSHWQRFECTGPLPSSPSGMRIRAIEGGGPVTLTHDSADPSVAMVHVDNNNRGEQLYTFDILWDNRPLATQGYAERTMSDEDIVQSCRSAVESRIRGDGYRYVRFGSIFTEDRGSHERVMGTVTADRPDRSHMFDFACRVDADNGQVRSVDVTRR